MDTLGSRLRRKRRERGWTQEELALRAGTNQAVIQKIENGKSLR
ncbi:MAG: helix-turn-helix transcriptional regulator, partial [Candidatus Thiodiazotropha sp. 6PDIVS]